jgi:MoaD family protein
VLLLRGERMAISIEVPQIFRRHTNGSKVLSVTGATIREILSRLEREYPELRLQLQGPDGRLHRFVNIYLNDEDIRYIQDLDTPLKDGDRVSILPAVAGGCDPRDPVGSFDARAPGGFPAVAGRAPGQRGTELRS